MWMHFCSRHVRDIVIILEEGNFPHPRCSRCDIMVPWKALNGRPQATALCRQGEERKRQRIEEDELRDRTERAFDAYGNPIEMVKQFKYLGRLMTAGDENWPAVLRPGSKNGARP